MLPRSSQRAVSLRHGDRAPSRTIARSCTRLNVHPHTHSACDAIREGERLTPPRSAALHSGRSTSAMLVCVTTADPRGASPPEDHSLTITNHYRGEKPQRLSAGVTPRWVSSSPGGRRPAHSLTSLRLQRNKTLERERAGVTPPSCSSKPQDPRAHQPARVQEERREDEDGGDAEVQRAVADTLPAPAAFLSSFAKPKVN